MSFPSPTNTVQGDWTIQCSVSTLNWHIKTADNSAVLHAIIKWTCFNQLHTHVGACRTEHSESPKHGEALKRKKPYISNGAPFRILARQQRSLAPGLTQKIHDIVFLTPYRREILQSAYRKFNSGIYNELPIQRGRIIAVITSHTARSIFKPQKARGKRASPCVVLIAMLQLLNRLVYDAFLAPFCKPQNS